MSARKTHESPGVRALQALEMPLQEIPMKHIAERMGVTLHTAHNLVRNAKIRLGQHKPTKRYTTETYAALFHGTPCDEDGVADTTPGCARCHLRGEHVCLPDRADPYARRGEPYYVRNRTS